MHIVIINGSPRVLEFSNTDKIIQSFGKGLQESGATYELYSLSNRKEWDAACEAFISYEQITFAVPLYVECVPSIMLEFLESLPTERQHPAQMSFILHGGFDEGHQMRLCERFLQSLPEQFGCTYGGCLTQGGSFLIRMRDDEKMKKAMEAKLDGYTKMGQSFASHGNFMTTEARKFTGPEKNPWFVHLLFRLFIKRLVRKNFEHCAQFVDEVNKGLPQPITKEEYIGQMKMYFPHLKRWRKELKVSDGAPENPALVGVKELIGKMADTLPVSFISSVDEEGYPCTKAMLSPRVLDGIKVFYYTTNTFSLRVAHYKANPKACIYFCDAEGFKGMMLRGTTEVLTDAASKERIWRDGDTEYYPGGVTDPNYCVLKFTATDGRFYSDFFPRSFVIE